MALAFAIFAGCPNDVVLLSIIGRSWKTKYGLIVIVVGGIAKRRAIALCIGRRATWDE